MTDYADTHRAYESSISSISWAAIFAGAFTAWAITLVIVTVASAIGFGVISPYNSSANFTNFHVATGVVTVVTAALASTFGGYMAGRLRTRWVGIHTDEVYFRDTAHGFLSWALATFIGALMIALSATAVAGGAVTGIANNMTPGLMRSDTADTSRAMTSAPETSGTTAPAEEASAGDKEAARKIAVRVSLWLAASLLAGAFFASCAATWGGRIRDRSALTV